MLHELDDEVVRLARHAVPVAVVAQLAEGADPTPALPTHVENVFLTQQRRLQGVSAPRLARFLHSLFPHIRMEVAEDEYDEGDDCCDAFRAVFEELGVIWAAREAELVALEGA